MADFRDWATDGWECGAPSLDLFSNALQVWALMQGKTMTVAAAAAAFNVPPMRIVQAVEGHDWMFLDGHENDYANLTIEHEGL